MILKGWKPLLFIPTVVGEGGEEKHNFHLYEKDN